MHLVLENVKFTFLTLFFRLMPGMFHRAFFTFLPWPVSAFGSLRDREFMMVTALGGEKRETRHFIFVLNILHVYFII